MSRTKTIKIAKEYTKEPAGRYYSDGPFSGQKFRKEFLVENLRNYDKLIIDFDGTEGAGSSFLDEAFGKLVSIEGFSLDQLRGILEFVSTEDPSILGEIWSYISSAKPKEKNAK